MPDNAPQAVPTSIYSDEDLDRILASAGALPSEVTGMLPTLLAMLGDLAVWYVQMVTKTKRIEPAKLAGEYAKIISHFRKGADGLAAIEEVFVDGVGRPEVDQELAEVKSAISKLEIKLEQARTPARRGKSKTWEARWLDIYVGRLADIYQIAFDNEPYKGDENGPFNRYLEACLVPVFRMTGENIKSRDALHGTWRNRSPYRLDPLGMSAFDD